MMSPKTTITDVKRTSVAFPATMSFPRPVVTDTAQYKLSRYCWSRGMRARDGCGNHLWGGMCGARNVIRTRE